MSEIIKVIECVYTPADDNCEKAKGYILAEDYANLIPYDSEKWHKLVKYTHADYCPAGKNAALRGVQKVLDAMPFNTGEWPCECFDDTFRFDTGYKVKRGYVEIEFEHFEHDEISMSYLIKKSQLLTQAWENPENPGKWLRSSPSGETQAARKTVIKGLCVNSPTDEIGVPIYLTKHYR